MLGLGLCLAVLPGLSYKYAGNCVPGTIVAGMEQTSGKIGLYVLALHKLLPIYGNLALMAEGPDDQCQIAADAVNVNQAKPAEILTKFLDMKQLGAVQALNKAVVNRSYLYVFRSKAYAEYATIADCVPGPIVGGLSQTGGRIALYSIALKTILPGIFGDLIYLGSGNASSCMDMMNKINQGNRSVLDSKQETEGSGMKEVGIIKGLNVAANETSYLYVFKNKMWNGTWNVMLPSLQHYGLPDDFQMPALQPEFMS